MTFRGVIRNGRVRTERSIGLPEGTAVRIEPDGASSKAGAKARRSKKDPAFRIGDDAVPLGPPDLAAEHKHYLYGTPKRTSKSSRRASDRKGKRR